MAKLKIHDLQEIGRYEREKLDIPIKDIGAGSVTKTLDQYLRAKSSVENKIVDHLNKNQEIINLFHIRNKILNTLIENEKLIHRKYSDLILNNVDFTLMFNELKLKHLLSDKATISEHVLKIILGFEKNSYYLNVVDNKLMIRLYWEDEDKWIEMSNIINKSLDLKTGKIEDFNPTIFINHFHKHIEERKSRNKIDFNDWEEWEKWIQEELYILETVNLMTNTKTSYIILNKDDLKLGDGYDHRYMSVKTQTEKITSLEYKLDRVSNVDRSVFSTVTFDFKLPTSFINEFITGISVVNSKYEGIKYFPIAPL